MTYAPSSLDRPAPLLCLLSQSPWSAARVAEIRAALLPPVGGTGAQSPIEIVLALQEAADGVVVGKYPIR